MTAWNQLKSTALATRQVRQVDRLAIEQYGMHSLVLMENAALECVHWIRQRFSTALQTVILCGRGNNGGDGLVIARHLQVHGWPCEVILWGPEDRLSPDAKTNLQILRHSSEVGPLLCDHCSDVSLNLISQAELVIDAMLGTGATGDPRAPLAEWIRAANQLDAFRLAIDIPTGVDADTGQQFTPVFRPHVTLSFVALKPAMALKTSRELFGEIEVLPIGIPNSLITRILEESGSW